MEIVAVGPETSTNLETVDIGKVDVEDDKIGFALLGRRHCLEAVVRRGDLVAGEAQRVSKKIEQYLLVVNDEDA